MRNDKKRKSERTSPKRNIKTMDIVLILVAVLLIGFTVKMIFVFEEMGSIPDTLCTCVFAALGGECGIMGWIKTTKDKYTDRKWMKEDQNQENEKTDPAETQPDNTEE